MFLFALKAVRKTLFFRLINSTTSGKPKYLWHSMTSSLEFVLKKFIRTLLDRLKYWCGIFLTLCRTSFHSSMVENISAKNWFTHEKVSDCQTTLLCLVTSAFLYLTGCLYDPANVQQTSANVFKIHVDVCWIVFKHPIVATSHIRRRRDSTVGNSWRLSSTPTVELSRVGVISVNRPLLCVLGL